MPSRAGDLCVRAAAVLALATATVAFAQTVTEHFRLAKEAAAKGRWDLAERESRLHLRQFANDSDGAVLHATALVHLNQPFDAALELEDFLKRSPNSVAVGGLYAALLADVIGDRNKAEEVLLHCSRVAPKDPAAWEALGKLYLGRRKEDDALRCYREAVRLAPANPVFAAGLAVCLERRQMNAEAATQYAKALRLNAAATAPSTVVYSLYAAYLDRAGRLSESVTFYTKALLLDPHSSDSYLGRALVREKLKDFRNAEADAMAALRESPRRRDARQLLIRIFRASGDDAKISQQAEAMEREANEEEAELARGREMRAALNTAEPLLAQGKFAEAIPNYERVVASAPHFYEAYFALGVCYQQTGQSAKAESALKSYLSYQPLSADGHAALGLLQMDRADKDGAKGELRRALELNSELVEPRKALAQLSMESRDYGEAIRLLAPLATTPDAQAQMMTAQAQFSLGQREKALAVVESALARMARNPQLEELHIALLMDCRRSEACKAKAIQSWRANPASPAYLKGVTEMLIENSAIDPTTVQMVQLMQKTLPSDAGALFVHAKWSMAANKVDDAQREASELLKLPNLEPLGKARAWGLAAVAADRLGRYEEAKDAFVQAIALNSKLSAPDPQLAMAYADYLVKQSNETEADAVVSDILRWAPAFAPARMRRATYLASHDKPEIAVAEAQKVLQLADGDAGLLRAAHALLAKTLNGMNRPAQAKIHQDWIVAH